MIVGMPFLLEHSSVQEACVLCRALKLDFVELNANFPICQTERLNMDELRRLKDACGVDFTIHVEEAFDPFAFQAGIREAWLASFRSTVELAKELEIPVVTMHLPHGVYMTLPGERSYLYARYPGEYNAALREFRNMCEVWLQGSNVRIAIENTDGFMPHEQKAVAYLLESPAFGLTLDVGHLHGAGYGDLPLYEAHWDKLVHMHVHDAQGRKNHLALGDGEIDMPVWFDKAEQCGASVVLEVKETKALHQSVQWLRERR